jgi:murein DD-endopeptidase MepM/ murein hydrolase activator NlpD
MRPLELILALSLVVTPAAAFDYLPPGGLIAGSGEGRVDETVYAPDMRFPIENAPAFANSQVYNPGGSEGPPGHECDPSNYTYPWRDNYCETRDWDMPLCPAGQGHQGQDIRPATCDKDTHWAVAATDGTITSVGDYSVYLTAADGTRYDYLHMSGVQVVEGQEVSRGERLGLVSNEFGGESTTIHLHFNIRQNVQGVGVVYVPPYMSLIQSYQRLIGVDYIPLMGDWDGDGIDTPGLFKDGTWYLSNHNSAGGVDLTFGWGSACVDYIPLVGDWDGDGIDTPGLFSSPAVRPPPGD